MRQTRYILMMAMLLSIAICASAQGRRKATEAVAKNDEIAQIAYAWRSVPPLGLIETAPMDTLEYNFYQHAIPSEVSYAYACTGNLGAEGKNMIFHEQKPISDFFLKDAQSAWLPLQDKQKFYNTRIPMTLVTYDAGGGRNDGQERLTTIFSGNVNKRTQFGANIDYIYSKGSYDFQAAKGLVWGLNGSYLGDRYEVVGSWNHYNLMNKENGGITDDLYILDPAQLQGGVASINPKSIPTNLQHATTRIVGGELYLNQRYKVGYWKEERDEELDSVISREYIPVTSFIWTLQFQNGRHRFLDKSKSETDKFFQNTYLNPSLTEDKTLYSKLTNTVGISLLEGFNKWAKFGLAAYVKYEIRKFTQTVDTLDRTDPSMVLTPYPEGIFSVLDKKSQNMAWVGGQLTKQQGSILRYAATGEIGFLGDAAGEIKIDGNLTTRVPLFGDTVSIEAYGSLRNTSIPYLLQEYRSNHFVWQNNFDMERRVRFGGILEIPWTHTRINVSTETLQNYVYFNSQAVPQQIGDAIQVFSASLHQNFKFGILHWDNKATYQTSTNDWVLPLPKFALYSNLYLLCNIATLHLQLGLDCDYYTKYYAPNYQPATATFHNQHDMKLGNYPFMTAYANMKLGRTRFYVMMTHVNQGIIGGNNYFAIPHYPLNPRRFQLGLSVDFHN